MRYISYEMNKTFSMRDLYRLFMVSRENGSTDEKSFSDWLVNALTTLEEVAR